MVSEMDNLEELVKRYPSVRKILDFYDSGCYG